MSLVRVMTFNVLSVDGEPRHASEPWEKRANLNVKTIRRYKPSFIGFQELSEAHWATYRDRFPEYEHSCRLENGTIDSNAVFYICV